MPVQMTIITRDYSPTSLVVVDVCGRSPCPLGNRRIRGQTRWERRCTAAKADDRLAIAILQSVRIAILQLTMATDRHRLRDPIRVEGTDSLKSGLFHFRHILVCTSCSGAH